MSLPWVTTMYVCVTGLVGVQARVCSLACKYNLAIVFFVFVSFAHTLVCSFLFLSACFSLLNSILNITLFHFLKWVHSFIISWRCMIQSNHIHPLSLFFRSHTKLPILALSPHPTIACLFCDPRSLIGAAHRGMGVKLSTEAWVAHPRLDHWRQWFLPSHSSHQLPTALKR